MQDIRFALRTLRKQPIFAVVAILTLTLGIGANTAIFSLVYQTLLEPLPYANADRLVFVWNTYPLMGLPQASVSIPDYIDRSTQAAAIEDATLFTTRTISLVAGAQPEQLRALAVTPSFLSTLGRQPVLGRGFTDAEATPDADKFVILANGLWVSRFGADRRARRARHSVERGGLSRRRDSAGRLRPAFTRRRRARAVLLHAAADVRSGPRQRVQLDDRAAAAWRDDPAARRADEGDRAAESRAAAAVQDFCEHERFWRLRRRDSRSARRRRADAALRAAGRRARRAVDRVCQRRQSAPDARDRPLPRACDQDDARGGAVAAGAAARDRGGRARDPRRRRRSGTRPGRRSRADCRERTPAPGSS